MSKKDKKIEVQLSDSQVAVNGSKLAGYQLSVGKKTLGQIAEIEDKFAVVANGQVLGFHKQLERAVESIIETYNLNN